MTAVRCLCLPVVLVALLVVTTGVTGEETDSWTITDPEGDVDAPGGVAAAWAFVDLTEVTVHVNETHLVVDFTVAGTTGQEVTTATRYATFGAVPSEYWLEFDYRGQQFVASLLYEAPLVDESGAPPAQPTQPQFSTGLYRLDDGEWTRLSTDGAAERLDQLTLQGRWILADVSTRDSFEPTAGEPLMLVQAVAFWDESGVPFQERAGTPLVTARDDADFPIGAAVVVPGIGGDLLRLSTPEPIRYSNGEATTFHWPVMIEPLAGHGIDATVRVTGPQDTRLDYTPVIQVDSGETAILHVYATVPFQHQHGGSREFAVIVSGPDGVQGGLLLSIEYLETPQPAGHHSMLYVHFQESGVVGRHPVWMNTLIEDAASSAAQGASYAVQCGLPGSSNGEGWFIPLRPGLSIGLDGRLEDASVLTASLIANAPLVDGPLLARLVLYDPASSSVSWAADEYTAQVQLNGQRDDRLAIELDLPTPPELDLVLPGSGMNLALALVYCPFPTPLDVILFNAVAQVRPHLSSLILEAGATVQLAVDEYRDPINLAIDTSASLTANEATKRIVPGGTAVWRVAVDAPTGQSYTARLIGVDADHANIHSPQATWSHGMELIVWLDTPSTARHGDVFEFILVLEEAGSGAAAAALRLVAVTDTTGVDEVDLLQGLSGQARTPGPGVLATIALCILVASQYKRNKNH